jgi:hypothetical protein
MTTDNDRDRIERPEDERAGGYPAMPPLDAVDPDLEQEGERPDPPESGWGGAARAAEGDSRLDENEGR